MRSGEKRNETRLKAGSGEFGLVRAMTPGAAEALKEAFRRSLPLAALLVVLGAVAVNAIRQYDGPRYEASAEVFLSTVDLAAALAGTQPPYVDPRRTIENAVALARSAELYERAAANEDGELGDGSDLRGATSVSGSEDSDVITFTATAATSDRATGIVNAVASEYGAYRADIALASIRSALSQLRREIAASPEEEPSLRQQLNRLELLETLSSSDATLIERATSADKTTPKPLQDTVLGAALGLVIALLIAGTREVLNTKVRSEAEVEELLERPVLASIQTLPKRTRLVTLGGRHEARFSDTYALLAANLTQIRGDGEPMTLAITSALKGEGKTTTAANLAVAFARRGARVILTDFDVRRPSMASLFQIPATSPGVLQIISGEAKIIEALWAISLNGSSPDDRSKQPRARPIGRGTGERPGPARTAIDGGAGRGSLRVLPAGGSVRGGTVAQSPRVAEMLKRLKQDADVVIVDTPPALLAVEMAELSRDVDVIVVVARQGKVTRRGLRSLNRQAQGWQAEIAGAVVTDSPSEDDYSYYGT